MIITEEEYIEFASQDLETETAVRRYAEFLQAPKNCAEFKNLDEFPDTFFNVKRTLNAIQNIKTKVA